MLTFQTVYLGNSIHVLPICITDEYSKQTKSTAFQSYTKRNISDDVRKRDEKKRKEEYDISD